MAMAEHAVKGIISFPFEVEVDTDSPETFSLNDLLAAVGARNSGHFGVLAFDETSNIYIDDRAGAVTISSVEAGSIWFDDGLPVVGIADGKGGIVWQEA
jgi:hypothetical protein